MDDELRAAIDRLREEGIEIHVPPGAEDSIRYEDGSVIIRSETEPKLTDGLGRPCCWNCFEVLEPGTAHSVIRERRPGVDGLCSVS